MTKAEIEKKKSLARSLFLSGMEQTEIAEKVDVSRVTISKWCTADGWKEARAAKNVTRPELVNKLLLTIDTLITQVNESNDPALVAGLGDKLAKLSAVIEKLDKKANVVDVIEVFMAFSKWIEYRSTIDPEVTPELGIVANARQKQCLERAREQVKLALDALDAGELLDAVTVLLEEAADALLTLTGERVSDAVVNDVFSRFCVGK